MTETSPLAPRVLSIQSHVVHGYVGNKCAVYALQLLGIDVDPINTVHFSNNTGYPTWRGQVLQADQMWDIFEGLLANDLAHYTHVLTGYVNSPRTLETIMRIVRELKQRNPQLKYFCDPVMGDDGQLYRSVPMEMVELYKKEVLPFADVLFPNQTEAEFLTGIKITSDETAFEAISKIHEYGISVVILKSLFYDGPDSIVVLGSHKSDSGTTRWKMKFPKLPYYFTGTGDLFSSLMLAYSVNGNDIPLACQKTVSAIQAVLQRSKNNKGTMKEISLIQSRDDILRPQLLESFTLL